MRALLLTGAVLLSASSCALIEKAAGKATPKIDSNLASSAREVDRAAGEVKKAHDTFVKPFSDATELCSPLKDRKVPWEEERQIGGAVALSLASQGNGYFIELSKDLPPGPLDTKKWADKKVKPPVGDKAKLTEYLNNVGQYVAGFSDRPGIHWTFVVLDNTAANAFSAPGGYVFVTTGLLKLVDNEAQLAAILAHEVGHVTARDSINAYQKGKYEACKVSVAVSTLLDKSPGLDLGGVIKSDFVPEGVKNAVGSLSKDELRKSASEMRAAATGTKFNPGSGSTGLVMLISDVTSWVINHTGYASENELKADATAHDLMAMAGYDPAEFAKLMAKLPDGGAISPHPSNKDRVAKFNALPSPVEGFELVSSAPANGDALKVIR